MTMTHNSSVLVDSYSDSRRDLTLNEVSTGNALSSDIVDQLIQEVQTAKADQIKLLVIKSSSRIFCSGFDIRNLDNERDSTLLLRFTKIGLMLEAIADYPFKTVAIVEGSAVGAGADLALACDHRIGTKNASFRFPGAKFGLILGTHRLAELLGEQKALELTTSDAKLFSNDAQSLGAFRIESETSAVEEALIRLNSGVNQLSLETVYKLKRASRKDSADQALSELIRSIAANPGIKERMTDYIEGIKSNLS